MEQPEQIVGVLLSSTMDLKAFYGLDFKGHADNVVLYKPEEVPDPNSVRFAVCWAPATDAFDAYPNLAMAMSVGAGVDALLNHPGIGEHVEICRVRDPHQADLMGGYAAHEVLHVSRGFSAMSASQATRAWAPLPMTPPAETQIAVLGNGTMGVAVAKALKSMGFSVRVACRKEPTSPLEGVAYFAGEGALLAASTGCSFVVNVLPLTAQTENCLDKRLFDSLAKGAWLIQIGRGEHLHDDDFLLALKSGQLAGASLDVFREEPLPVDHPFWSDERLRITPHIASDSTPSVVKDQVLQSALQLAAGAPLQFAINRSQGY